MPTYEYKCAEGHHFEQFQRMSDPPVAECPTCGAVAERLLSAGTGLHFKGSGFYITDYRSDSYQKAAQADTGKPAAGEGGEKVAGEKSSDKPASTGTSSAGSAGSTGSATDAAARQDTTGAAKKRDAGSGGAAGGGS